MWLHLSSLHSYHAGVIDGREFRNKKVKVDFNGMMLILKFIKVYPFFFQTLLRCKYKHMV
jgi:hypothetical protein